MPPDVSQAAWRKSSRSGGTNGNCVELARTRHMGGVRDSKNPNGPILTFGQTELSTFLDAVKVGLLDG